MSKKKEPGEKCVKQNISIEPEQLKRITALCQREERTISWVIRKALDKYLETSA